MGRRLWQTAFTLIFGVFIIQQAIAKIKPSVIYGDDDRIDYFQIVDETTLAQADSTVALVRSASLEPLGDLTTLKTSPYGTSMGLCTTEPYWAQETLAFCSGSLVAPDIVLTAGHCLRTQATCDSTKFVFGFRVGDPVTLPKQVPSEYVFSCKQLIHTVADPQGEDFALVRLDRPVTHVKPLPYRQEGRLNVGDGLKVMGHPSGLPLKIAGGASVRTMKDQFLIANLDTYGGNSGSAVFNAETGLVEGVLVRGEMDYTYQNGCRLSNRCPDAGCRGEDVTLFERVLPALRAATGP